MSAPPGSVSRQQRASVSQLVRRHLAREAGDHQHAAPVDVRRIGDHVVQLHRKERRELLNLGQGVAGAAAALRISDENAVLDET